VLLLLAWSLARRDWATLPATALVASFLVQTHVAFALLVALVLGAAATLAFVRPPSPREHASRRALVVTAVLLALVWAPVVIDQVAGTHNASRTVRYFATGQDAHAGFADGLGVTATEMMPIGPWVRGPEEVVPFSGEAPPSPTRQLALPLLALATSAAVTLKRRDRDGFALVVVASVAVGACVVSIARITGQVWPYLIRFTWAVAAVVWLAVGRALVPAVIALVEPRVPATWRAKVTAPPGRVAATAVPALVVLAVTLSLAPLDARPPDPIESENLARIVAAVDAAPVAALPGAGVVLVRPANIDILFPAPDSRGITAGLVAALRKRGVDARVVDGDWRFDSGLAGVQMFGDWRVDDGASPVAGTITIVDALTIDTYQPQAGEIELFRLDNPAEVAEIHQIEADLAREFTAAGHPEAIPLIAGEGVRWVGFNIPELGQFGAQTDRLLTLRGHRREAVFWRPSR